MHRQLGQVERRRKVEGFHRERWGSCALSLAMGVYHFTEERCRETLKYSVEPILCPITRGEWRLRPVGQSSTRRQGYASTRSRVSWLGLRLRSRLRRRSRAKAAVWAIAFRATISPPRRHRARTLYPFFSARDALKWRASTRIYPRRRSKHARPPSIRSTATPPSHPEMTAMRALPHIPS
jgi:hypothetical protein